MRDFFRGRKRYLFPLIHFLLSFWYERRIFLFEQDIDFVLPIPRNNIISDAAERVMGYAISKLFAAVLILFLWHLIFWVIRNWSVKKNVRFFLAFFAVSLIGVLIIWPFPFLASADNYITYSFARRFWPEYWHNAYSGFLYAAALMVAPSPVFISVYQLIFGFFVLGYLYNRIVDSPVLKGRGKYFVFLIFILPGTYTLFTDSYRTEQYAMLCMFAVTMTAMDIVDRRKRGTCFLVCNILLCGFISVWRTEGIILGFLLFLVQLLFVYRYKPLKSALLFLCLLLAFGAFLLPQKLGDIKYYGKDYSFINSFPSLRNILASADANLSYEGVEEDLAALEAVTPVELIRYYGMDGYRRYNYANGRPDINQSLAEDETASAYLKAYYRILWHNLPIYAQTQVSALLKAIMVIPEEYIVNSDQIPVHDLPPWTLKAWEQGYDDFVGTGYVTDWSNNVEVHQRSYVFARNLMVRVTGVLRKIYFYSLILILIPLFEIFLFFNEGIRLVRKKRNLFGLAGIAFLLLGQAVAIVLVMPAGFTIYLHTYYYCSFILCLIYAATVRTSR